MYSNCGSASGSSSCGGPISVGGGPASNFSIPSGGANNASSGGGNQHRDIRVCEEVEIAVAFALERFMRSAEEKELLFPSSFTSVERAYVHKLARDIGLKSKSAGKVS